MYTSEYIEIEAETSDDGESIFIYKNLRLSEGLIEEYNEPEALDKDSPLAQALALIEAIAYLRIEDSDLIISCQPDIEWYLIVEVYRLP